MTATTTDGTLPGRERSGGVLTRNFIHSGRHAAAREKIRQSPAVRVHCAQHGMGEVMHLRLRAYTIRRTSGVHAHAVSASHSRALRAAWELGSELRSCHA
jgi:hypothetical protein